MAVVKKNEAKETTHPLVKPVNGKLMLFLAMCGWSLSALSFYGAYHFGTFIPVPSSFAVATKLGYALKWLLIPTFFIVFAVNESGALRGKHSAHPLAGKDHLFQIQKNVLMNTIEQYCLFLVPLLALAASVQTAEQLRFIPTACVLFFVGRVFFRLGYPNNRGFGYSINFFLVVFLFGANGYLTYKYGLLSGIEDKTPTVSGKF